MSYLCKLITPPNGIVLDPFMGSGSTGKGAVLEGFQFIGMDMEQEYCEIAEARIEFALRSLEKSAPVKKTKTVKRDAEAIPQEDVPSLFDL